MQHFIKSKRYIFALKFKSKQSGLAKTQYQIGESHQSKKKGGGWKNDKTQNKRKKIQRNKKTTSVLPPTSSDLITRKCDNSSHFPVPSFPRRHATAVRFPCWSGQTGCRRDLTVQSFAPGKLRIACYHTSSE